MGAGAAFAAAAGIQAISSIAGSYSDYQASKEQARQYNLQSQQLEFQKNILSDQYRTKRNQLQGSAIAKAGASGVKVSGSVANSINTSLTELGMEESYRKFNINMEQNNLNYNAKATKARAKQRFLSSLIGTGANALANYSTYQTYWGTPVRDVTGTAGSGGNVMFTNSSYIG